MSAKLGAMIARYPASSRAHGACSRDEPEPKFLPATRIGAPANSGPVQREVGILPPLEEEALGEAGALDALEELLRDDLIGVDVRAIERRDRARDLRECLHV